MSSYITDRYAGMLTEEDVTTLFNLLAKELGDNRSEAARRCRLTGKATYDWESATYVKLGTKKKVLEASLRGNFLNTVEYLLGRSTDSSQDLLRTVLGTLYSNALESSSSEDFKNAYTKFEQTRIRHKGMIRDEIQIEVTDMATTLREKAEGLGLAVNPRSTSEFSAEELLTSIRIIGQIYSENPLQAETFAEKEMDLPRGALKPIIETFNILCMTKKIHTNASDEADKKMKLSIVPKPLLATPETIPWIKYYHPYGSQENAWTHSLIGKEFVGGNVHEITTIA